MRVPDIKVTPPGPRARAIVERDARGRVAVVSAVRAVRHGARRRRRRRRCRRERVSGFRRRHRGGGDRAFPSRRRPRDHRAGIEISSHIHRLLSRAAGRAGRGAREHRPDRRSREDVFFQFRHRGRRGRDQAGAVSHQALQHHRVSRVVSRPHAWIACADDKQNRAAPRLRSDGARCVSRAVCEPVPMPAGRTRCRELHARVPCVHRESDPHAGRVARRGRCDRRRAHTRRRRVYRSTT